MYNFKSYFYPDFVPFLSQNSQCDSYTQSSAKDSPQPGFANHISAFGNTKILPAKDAAAPVSPELVVPATAELSTNV